MKKNKYKVLIVLVVGLFILVPGIVLAAKIIESSNVSYDNSTTGLPSNVQGAIDTLYTRQNKDLNNYKKKYYDLVSKNANNAPLVDFIRGVLRDDGATILQDDGTAGHNMRYIGASPNNWISFNGELWRIIGVFGTDSHGKSEELIKIQYSRGLGAIPWDANGKNDWSQATLKTYLNEGEYYNTTLNADARQMIQEVNWRVASVFWTQESFYANAFYTLERGNVGAPSNPTLLEWSGNVALAYPSDYIFATNGGPNHNREECVITTPARYYSNTDSHPLWRTDGANAGECATGSWMFKQAISTNTNAWFLTPQQNSSNRVYCFGYYTNYDQISGPISDNSEPGSRQPIPAVYLKSNVICTNCAESNVGTESNPFKIKLG